MHNTKPANLCEICRKQFDCMRNGIVQQQNCDQYDPLSLEELAQRDEFIKDAMVGSCPSCGSEKTYDCDNFLEQIDDPTIGHCLDCGAYWCLECGSILNEEEKKSECRHWTICGQCSDYNEYGCPFSGITSECPKIRAFLEEES